MDRDPLARCGPDGRCPAPSQGNGRNRTQASGLPVVLQEITDNDLHLDFVEPPKGYFESTYVYGLDLISATDEDGVQTYYFSDGLGSTTTVADAGGGVASEYAYDVFGELRGQSGVPDDVMLFTGEQYDAKARHNAPGLYYLRPRFLRPNAPAFRLGW